MQAVQTWFGYGVHCATSAAYLSILIKLLKKRWRVIFDKETYEVPYIIDKMSKKWTLTRFTQSDQSEMLITNTLRDNHHVWAQYGCDTKNMWASDKVDMNDKVAKYLSPICKLKIQRRHRIHLNTFAIHNDITNQHYISGQHWWQT